VLENEKRNCGRNICPSAICRPPTWTGLGSNAGLCDKKPAINRLSHSWATHISNCTEVRSAVSEVKNMGRHERTSPELPYCKACCDATCSNSQIFRCHMSFGLRWHTILNCSKTGSESLKFPGTSMCVHIFLRYRVLSSVKIPLASREPIEDILPLVRLRTVAYS
jgi:hypothetical protein